MYWQHYPAVYAKRLLRIAHLASFFGQRVTPPMKVVRTTERFTHLIYLTLFVMI
jgi:hypothetical protein